MPDVPHRNAAVALFATLVRADQPAEFLTLPAQALLDRASLG